MPSENQHKNFSLKKIILADLISPFLKKLFFKFSINSHNLIKNTFRENIACIEENSVKHSGLDFFYCVDKLFCSLYFQKERLLIDLQEIKLKIIFQIGIFFILVRCAQQNIFLTNFFFGSKFSKTNFLKNFFFWKMNLNSEQNLSVLSESHHV